MTTDAFVPWSIFVALTTIGALLPAENGGRAMLAFTDRLIPMVFTPRLVSCTVTSMYCCPEPFVPVAVTLHDIGGRDCQTRNPGLNGAGGWKTGLLAQSAGLVAGNGQSAVRFVSCL